MAEPSERPLAAFRRELFREMRPTDIKRVQPDVHLILHHLVDDMEDWCFC